MDRSFTMSGMQPEVFHKRSRIEAPADIVFNWHLRDGAFERLNIPWEQARVVSRTGRIEDGGTVELQMPVGPFHQRWVAKHQGFIPGEQFQDVQVRGPFASLTHTH